MINKRIPEFAQSVYRVAGQTLEQVGTTQPLRALIVAPRDHVVVVGPANNFSVALKITELDALGLHVTQGEDNFMDVQKKAVYTVIGRHTLRKASTDRSMGDEIYLRGGNVVVAGPRNKLDYMLSVEGLEKNGLEIVQGQI